MTKIIHNGTLVLHTRGVVVETWLHETVVPAFDAIKADPSRGVGIERIRARLAAEHRAGKKSRW